MTKTAVALAQSGTPVALILSGQVMPVRDLGAPRALQRKLPNPLLPFDDARNWMADKRTRLYVRESSTKQKDKFGPDDQRSAGRRAVAKYKCRAWDQEYFDVRSAGGELSGKGGALLKRVAFLQAIRDAEAGLYDVLLVGRVDRFTRDDKDFWNTVTAFISAGVAVYFEEEDVLCGVDEKWTEIRDEVGSAASWLRKHGKRVKQGYAEKRKKQGATGGVNLGYEMDAAKDRFQPKHLETCPYAQAAVKAFNEKTGRPLSWNLDCPTRLVEVDGLTEEWPALCPIQLPRQVHLLYNTGLYTNRTLARRLTAFGFRSRRGLPISHSTVASILENAIVVGTRRLDVKETAGGTVPGDEVKAWIPGIIDEHIFAENQRRSTRAAQRKTPNKSDHDVMPFADVLRCLRPLRSGETCGERLNRKMNTPDMSRPGQRIYRYGHPKHRGCHEPGQPLPVLGEQTLIERFREFAHDLVLTPAEMKLLEDYHKGQQRLQVGALETAADLQAQLDRFGELYADGTWDRAKYHARKKEVEAKLAKASPVGLIPEERHALQIRSLARSWDALAKVPQTSDPETLFRARVGLRRTVDELCTEVYVQSDGRQRYEVQFVFKPHYMPLIKAAYVGDLSKLTRLIGQAAQREEVARWAEFIGWSGSSAAAA